MRPTLCIVLALSIWSPAGLFAQQPSTQTTATPPAPPAPPAKKKLYDESADARQQIAAAVAKAKAGNQRVLVQWGGNWCPWCIRLHEVMSSDKHLRKEIQYEYVVVHVDAGRPRGKNMDLAASLGAEINGFPFLTILDADGKPVAQAETEQFEVKGPDGKPKGVEAGHDRESLLTFLKNHEAPRQDARAVLDGGLARAKADGKSVFLHFGAPWCVWCHRLEDWMAGPEIAPVLAKDLILVKIDTDRMTGGQALLDSMNKLKNGGIPWSAVLDAEGRPVIDSNGEKGNIGYPAAAEEIAHFEVMINKARRNMTPQDVEMLKASLTDAAAKLNSR
ncbi:MAG: thioredoxin family protein [Phycisphaerae bacterium]|nr:thioredoxin family protein [Phycisphaerae bacterium]